MHVIKYVGQNDIIIRGRIASNSAYFGLKSTWPKYTCLLLDIVTGYIRLELNEVASVDEVTYFIVPAKWCTGVDIKVVI